MTPRDREALAGVVRGLVRPSLAELKAGAERSAVAELAGQGLGRLTETEPGAAGAPTVEDMRAIFFPEDEAT